MIEEIFNNNHKELIKLAKYFAFDVEQKEYPEDTVQELYIKILNNKNFIYEKHNKTYLIKTLKSIVIDNYKKKKIVYMRTGLGLNLSKYSRTENYKTEQKNKIKKEKILTCLELTISNMYWFDKKMLNLYMYRLPSIRKISKATDINSKVVFETLKRCKLIIKKQLICHYQNQNHQKVERTLYRDV